jgi:uncharacterized protein
MRSSSMLRALLAVLVGLIGLIGYVATAAAVDFPALSSHVIDPANAMDFGYRVGTTQELEAFEARTGIRVVVAIVKPPRGTSIDDYGAALFQDWGLDTRPNGRTALLAVNPAKNTAVVKVGHGLAAVLDDDVVGLIMAKRVMPHLAVNGVTGAASRGADTILEVLRRGPAGLRASEPEQVSWLEANRDRLFLRFLGGLIAFLVLALAINLATLAGWLPQKKRGLWRVLDWITGLAGAIRVESSSSSSSGSSGRGGRFGGGGGTSGGGGASGNW